MRILTLSNSPLIDAHGSGYVVLGYAEGLRSAGHRVDLFGPPQVEVLRGLRRGIRYRQALGMAVLAMARVARERYDVVEIYGGEGWLAAGLLVRWPRRSFVVVAHSNGLEPHCTEAMARAGAAGWIADQRSRYQLDLSPAYAAGFRAVDGVVTVSEFDREYGLAHRYARGRVVAIENPLPEEYFDADDSGPPERLIGFVGAWLPRKGIEIMRRDLPVVLREFPDWRLALVGVGSGFRAADHFPEDVWSQIEVVASADRLGALRALYRRFAIAIVPSLYESFGLTTAEAMANGAAVVATPVGFAHALRDGEEALLLSPPLSPGLAAALRRLMADGALRSRVAHAGRARVQRLRWRPAIATLEATYRSWIDESRRGSRTGASAA